MRQSGKCIKCDHRRLWVVEPVAQPDHDSSNIVQPLRVATRRIQRRGSGGLFGGPGFERAEIGWFSAYVCASCGYTEWYARDLERMAEVAEGEVNEGFGWPGSTIRMVDSTPPEGGPHR